MLKLLAGQKSKRGGLGSSDLGDAWMLPCARLPLETICVFELPAHPGYGKENSLASSPEPRVASWKEGEIE